MPTWRAAQIQNAYNGYITEEVVPFIRNDCNDPSIRIAVTGASAGAYHSGNQLFRRPDLFDVLIGMSGGYDVKPYCRDGYFDENCYFNSPVDFLRDVDGDHYWMIRNHCSVNMIGGQGSFENPESARQLARVLEARSIPYNHDLWGHDVNHDWPWWRKMLPHYVDRFWA
jgi:esterase/lipase superfamily enzyme